jgi:hypothetical protein
MSLGFAVAAAKIGVPITKFLLKHYLGEAAAGTSSGLLDIAAGKIADEESQRAAARLFEGIGDKIVTRLIPIFQEVDEGTAESIVYEIGVTLEGRVSAEFFVERDLDPARLSAAFRRTRPLPVGVFGQAETALYDRTLDEAVRYIIGIAQSLPGFQVTAIASTLGRLSRIGNDLEKTLEKINQIERLVDEHNVDETVKRYEADYRQSIQRNLDYLELFGADISLEAQRHSLSVGYVSLNIVTEKITQTTSEISSANLLFELLSIKGGRLPLRGHAGSGKSTLLRWLAIQAALGRGLYMESDLLAAFYLSSRRDQSQEWISKRSDAIVKLNTNEILLEMKSSNFRSLLQKTPAVSMGKTQLFSERLLRNYRNVYVSHRSAPVERIPFLIRLRDCTGSRLPEPENLPALIANELGRPPIDWVRSILVEGKGLLLFDGVDEVPNQRRETMRRDLEALIGRYPKNEFIVTTRPEAVPENWLKRSGFTEASLNPMSESDRREFIERWHAAVSDELARQGRPEDLSGLAEELIAKLSESPAVARLATNPLLCAAMCALHRDRHRRLPQSQSELCEALCHLLLHRRETESGPHLSDFPREYRDLTYEQKRAIVQEIAHYMVRNDESVISTKDTLAITHDALRGFPNGQPEDAPVVLRSLIERSGVLREQKAGSIDFLHNTIKEFLSAEMFVVARDYSLLARRSVDDNWRPVVLFASASRDREFSTELVKRILQLAEESKEPPLARRLKLAAVSCRYAALHMEASVVEHLAAIEAELIPPHNMVDAEALAGSADNVVPLLRYKRMLAREAAACVRTLRLIGTEAAKQVLEGYIGDSRQAVIAELGQAVNPLRLAAMRDILLRGEPISPRLSRQITDLTPLETVKDIERLTLRGAPISECDALGKIPSLKQLDLSATGITSLAPLSKLAELESLNVSETKVIDLRPLRNLVKLQYLDCDHTHVRDLSPLSQLKQLQRLNVRGSQVSNLRPLEPLASLYDLNIGELANVDWNSLSRIKSLNTLNAFKASGVNISALQALPNLRSLVLNATDIKDVIDLTSCCSLERLWISFTQVNDIQPLSRLPSLTELALINLTVENFSCLEALINLRHLWLSFTSFTNLGLLRDCADLEELNLDGTLVSNLEAITSLAKLKSLGLQDLPITDWRPLTKLPQLETVWLSDITEEAMAALIEISSLSLLLVRSPVRADFRKSLRARGVEVL